MRTDTEVYQKSVLSMTNFLPTAMGSAVRAPGTRWLRDIDAPKARIMPFLSTGNERCIALFTPSNVKLIRNIVDELDGGSDISRIEVPVGNETETTILYRQQRISNFSFYKDLEDWTYDPNEYPAKGSTNSSLGVFMDPVLQNTVRMVPRLYKYPEEIDTCTLQTEFEVETATNIVTLDYNIRYIENPRENTGGYTFQILVSKSADFLTDIVYDQTYNDTTFPDAGVNFNPGPVTTDALGVAFTGTLYVKMVATALPTADLEYSNPHFGVFYFKAYANAEAVLTEVDLVTPYTLDELDDLHYIQSPYEEKELIVTHPNHAPSRLWFDTVAGEYKFEAINFNIPPTAWAVYNYPATCGSYHGRLVLAGGQSFRIPSGDPLAGTSETVWCTEVGEWSTFTDPITGEVNPDDSVEFTATYRSPIQWVFGQKTLLVGALEYEYSASGEGIFSPGDLGVFLHSTHGSNNVQPAAFGEYVLFPSDGGTRIRSMKFQQEDDGWVSVDLSALRPENTEHGIKRMVRARSPHQMCWVLSKNGQIAVWNQEGSIAGWSRLRQQAGQVKDICVLANNNGVDVPFVVVSRSVSGVRKLYLEAYNDLTSDSDSVYLESHKVYQFDEPTSTITGLDHLEGHMVQVCDPYRYIGFWRVVGGQIFLGDDIGGDTKMNMAYVGLQSRCDLVTLPPQKEDPGATSKFSSFGVRVIASIRPIINGLRPTDRDTNKPTNLSNGLDFINDIQVPTRGWDINQSIKIWEQVPFRVEIAGVYGKIKTGEL